jgi:hypothetical protein
MESAATTAALVLSGMSSKVLTTKPKNELGKLKVMFGVTLDKRVQDARRKMLGNAIIGKDYE